MAGRRVRNNGGWKEAAEKKVKRHRRTRQIRVLEGAGMSGGKCGEARAGDTFKVADVTSNPQSGQSRTADLLKVLQGASKENNTAAKRGRKTNKQRASQIHSVAGSRRDKSEVKRQNGLRAGLGGRRSQAGRRKIEVEARGCSKSGA
ncbi:hypothetical protein C8J57DRAFT_1228341 [Mycena rebaudengoi]|nr:hypothetical protein C8J57DRAFT_1228341 [Mycena rebaudengoi]